MYCRLLFFFLIFSYYAPKTHIQKSQHVALSQATSVSAPASGEFACRTEPIILVDNLQETEDQIQIANRNSATFFVLYSYCLADDNQLGLKSRSTKDKSNKGATSAEAIRRNNSLFLSLPRRGNFDLGLNHFESISANVGPPSWPRHQGQTPKVANRRRSCNFRKSRN